MLLYPLLIYFLKVRYSDGGYVRFKKDDFVAYLVSRHSSKLESHQSPNTIDKVDSKVKKTSTSVDSKVAILMIRRLYFHWSLSVGRRPWKDCGEPVFDTPHLFDSCFIFMYRNLRPALSSPALLSAFKQKPTRNINYLETVSPNTPSNGYQTSAFFAESRT